MSLALSAIFRSWSSLLIVAFLPAYSVRCESAYSERLVAL